MLVSDALSQLQIGEKSDVHDVIPLNFLQNELVDESIQDHFRWLSISKFLLGHQLDILDHGLNRRGNPAIFTQ